jgi:hypothetical protein
MIQEKDELRSRIEAKQQELTARIKLAKADAQHVSRESVKRVEERLASIRKTLADGWDDLSESSMKKLNELLRDE